MHRPLARQFQPLPTLNSATNTLALKSTVILRSQRSILWLQVRKNLCCDGVFAIDVDASIFVVLTTSLGNLLKSQIHSY